MTKKVSFTFNGKDFECESGQTIAAALIAADQRELRSTRFGNEPRSIFCGIGICYDCVVIVDGIANQRSCLIEARDGMKVESAS
jgi:aerobic-type carbon monoxide dehydrogenase small subunit (CoxS/CutS family)